MTEGAPAILEIGPRPFVGRVFPESTLFFSTDQAGHRPEGIETLPRLADLWRALGGQGPDLVVCHPAYSAPWSARHLNRSLFSGRLLAGRSPLFRAFGPQFLRFVRRAPMVVLDQEDAPFIDRGDLFLLDRCRLWFKRELPVDRWRVFTRTAHRGLPTPRFRGGGRAAGRIEKLRPLSLGLPIGAAGLPPVPPPPKTVDVFFAGQVEKSSSIRPRGLSELRALAGEGVSLDIPDAPLPRAAFYERCAAARLVWSPEGLGWDCFRHYEAAAAGSVPLINQPTIERHRPLVCGEHALYYDPEPGGLTRAVRSALADRPALARIAAGGQAHVLEHHTPEAIARYVVAASLAGSSSTTA